MNDEPVPAAPRAGLPQRTSRRISFSSPHLRGEARTIAPHGQSLQGPFAGTVCSTSLSRNLAGHLVITGDDSMMVGSRRAFMAAAMAAVTCLVIEIGVAAQAPPQAAEKVPLTDEVFKSIQILKGIPVDTFFETMGMFASAMGNDCTFCHV